MQTQQQLIHLLVSNHDELVSYVAARFGNQQFACDIVQETCLRLLQKDSQALEQVVSPLALLKRISLHLAIDQYRRDKHFGQHIELCAELPDELPEYSGSEQFSLPELSLAREQYQQVLINEIRALPAVCQDVFILTQLYHMSQVDVAAQLGISRGMVIKHLSRALSQLTPVLFHEQ